MATRTTYRALASLTEELGEVAAEVNKLHGTGAKATLKKEGSRAALEEELGDVLLQIVFHAQIAAEMLKPYVRSDVYNMIRTHQDFQGRHYYEHLGLDPNARDQYVGEPWYELTANFADNYDQNSFDPDLVKYG